MSFRTESRSDNSDSASSDEELSYQSNEFTPSGRIHPIALSSSSDHSLSNCLSLQPASEDYKSDRVSSDEELRFPLNRVPLPFRPPSFAFSHRSGPLLVSSQRSHGSKPLLSPVEESVADSDSESELIPFPFPGKVEPFSPALPGSAMVSRSVISEDSRKVEEDDSDSFSDDELRFEAAPLEETFHRPCISIKTGDSDSGSDEELFAQPMKSKPSSSVSFSGRLGYRGKIHTGLDSLSDLLESLPPSIPEDAKILREQAVARVGVVSPFSTTTTFSPIEESFAESDIDEDRGHRSIRKWDDAFVDSGAVHSDDSEDERAERHTRSRRKWKHAFVESRAVHSDDSDDEQEDLHSRSRRKRDDAFAESVTEQGRANKRYKAKVDNPIRSRFRRGASRRFSGPSFLTTSDTY